MRLPLFATGIALCGVASAQTPDRARLQNAAVLPTIAIATEFGLSPGRALDLPDSRDLRPMVGVLEAEVKVSPLDSTRWRRLGEMLQELGETDRATAAFQKAVELLEKAQAKSPNDGAILAQLGECLRKVGRSAEAEATLSSAVRKSPREWRAWVALGNLSDAKAWKRLAVTEVEVEGLLKLTRAERMAKIATTYRQRLTPGAIAEAKRLTAQAQTYYDKAVAAAPAQSEPLFHRATSRMLREGGIAGLLSSLEPEADRGRSALNRIMAPEVVADLRKARRIAVDAPETIATAAMMEFFWTLVEAQTPFDELGTAAGWSKLPPAAQSSVIEASLRLGELSLSPNKPIAAAALEGAGLLAFLRGQGDKMEASLLKASNLRPLNARSLDLLTLAYLNNDRMDALVTLYRKRIETEDSARSRFILAKALFKQGKRDAAELQLKAGREIDPSDFACSAGMAAIQLQKGDFQNPMGFLAPFARSVADETLGPDDRAVWFLLSGIQQGLSGQPDRAKQLLDAGQKIDPTNPAFAEARAALG